MLVWSAPAACSQSLGPVVQPLQILRRQRNVERAQTVLQLVQRTWADQRHRRERLRQHIGERDMDRALAQPAGELDGAVAAAEILLGIPDPDQFLIVVPVAPGAVGEEAAALARPGEIRHQPGA